MDSVNAAPSPLHDAAQAPVQRNPPLAPSQELAYRNKCIQLKKRLAEIEANNDNTRRRIAAEKERVQKQRLLRAILLNQLREIMETPGKKFKPEELEKMGIVINGEADDEAQTFRGRSRPEGEVLLDDSSDNSDEDIPEPSDRPTRTRRTGPSYRGEAVMSSNAQQNNAALYQQPSLPTIAPANSYSPAAAREPLLTSSFQTPGVTESPRPYPNSSHSQFGQRSSDPQSHFTPQAQSSPTHLRAQPTPAEILGQSSHTSATAAARSLSTHASPQQDHTILGSGANGYRATPAIAQPVRPAPPVNQFYDHMLPQLEKDNYPREQIQARIDQEWRDLSAENRGLWQDRYNEQMREYEEQMDQWKRAQRRGGEVTPATRTSNVLGRSSSPGFR